jgi:hypothetical protein
MRECKEDPAPIIVFVDLKFDFYNLI